MKWTKEKQNKEQKINSIREDQIPNDLKLNMLDLGIEIY